MKNLIIAMTAVSALAACNTGSGTQTGQMSLQITDGAVTDASAVHLTISAVTVKGPDGMITYNITDENGDPSTRSIELLSLSGANAESIIEDWELTAGRYQWIRLHSVTEGIGDTYVTMPDGDHELTIPSSDLKLVSGFTIPANGHADFTVDIDLSKGLVESHGSYKLKPAMRLLNNAEAGHISGILQPELYSNNGCTDIAVYAFAGNDTPADDIFNDEGPELVAWADNDTGVYRYELGFLSAGDYTLHLACDPVDDPEADNYGPEVEDSEETVSFIEGQQVNITVNDKETVTRDFPI